MIKIHGESDDLIEIEGEITEEFNVYIEDDEHVILAISDGTLLKVQYDGCWRIVRVHTGRAAYTKTYEAVDPDDALYSDVIELSWGFPIEWIVLGNEYRKITRNKCDPRRFSATELNKSNVSKTIEEPSVDTCCRTGHKRS